MELKEMFATVLENASSDLESEARNIRNGICKYNSVQELRDFITSYITDEIEIALDDLEYGIAYE